MGARSLSIAARETPWYRLFLHTPLTTLAIFVILSLIAKENYPFSNFPMYASSSAERAYFVITDGEGHPIPIGTLTGVTSSQVGKTYRTKSRKHSAEMKKSAKEGSSGALLEAFAFLALANRRLGFLIGVGLVLMHRSQCSWG
jgi:hypothetical protein